MKDFQFILEVEPNNKEAMKDLKGLREQQDGKVKPPAQKKSVLENIPEEESVTDENNPT